MNWHLLLQEVRDAYLSVNGIERMSSPLPPFSIADLNSHEQQLEKSLRVEVDTAVLEHFNNRKLPSTHNHGYLIQYRYAAALSLLVALSSDAAPEAPQFMTEDQALRWLLVESWPTHGWGMWRVERESWYGGQVKGYALALMCVFKLPAPPPVSARTCILMLRGQTHPLQKLGSGTNSITASGGL